MNRSVQPGNGVAAIVPALPADTDAPSLPPTSLSDIPGLGPIRIRALQKAGLGGLLALRSATLQDLMAVPGLSEIKARHIQEFLANFTADDLAPAASAPPQTREDSSHGGEAVQTTVVLLDGTSSNARQLMQRAARAMGEVITLLLSPEAPQFRSRLLRVLGQFAQCAESLATDAVHLSADQQDRAIRRLRRASKELSDFTGSSASDKKAQGRLADALEEINAKLAECRLSTSAV